MESLEEYLAALASAAPTPGGGSAATIVGAAAAALVAMVARISRADALASEADALREHFLTARTADERAYGQVVAAMALPRGTVEEKIARTTALQTALAGAAAAPLHAADLAVKTLALAERARALENANLISDVHGAASFARAAVEASAANVRINHAYLKDAATLQSQAAALEKLEAEAAERYRAASAPLPSREPARPAGA